MTHAKINLTVALILAAIPYCQLVSQFHDLAQAGAAILPCWQSWIWMAWVPAGWAGVAVDWWCFRGLRAAGLEAR
jgi:hypothetical protein